MASKKRIYRAVGFSLWGLTLLVISILVFLSPSRHTVIPVYHEAVERWLASKSLYSGAGNSYFYFPQFILFFAPFHYVPMPFSDILWRVFQTALLVTGMWKMAELLPTSEKEFFFLCMSLVALTPSIGAMRNGQANVLFAALLIYSIVCLAQARWWLAALCMTLTLAIKPLGLVLILLAVIVYRLTRWRLVISLCIFFLAPFLFANSSYVISQYRQSFAHLVSSSLTTEHRFSDLNGLLQSLGIGLTGTVSQSVRVIAGILFAGLWWKGSKQVYEPERSFLLLGLASTYLMLLNPMTEVNSYVIVAPSVAYYAIRYLTIEVKSKLGWSLVFMGLSIGLLPELLRPFVRHLGLCWDPLMMICFLFFLAYEILRHTSSETRMQAAKISES